MTLLRDDLESATDQRYFGSGWISGAWAFVLSVLALGTVLCLRYPDSLSAPEARDLYRSLPIRLTLQLVMIVGFLFAAASLSLRKKKVLGTTAMGLILLAAALGGPRAESRFSSSSDLYFGLDFFLLNLIFLGLVFVPIERVLGKREQPIFRADWREDLLYFLIGSLLVQGLTYLSLAPSKAILTRTSEAPFRSFVASQPAILQLFEIMLLTDLVQYAVHRAFHHFSWLWRFHAIHHSAPVMDWLASSRMHLMEVVCLRAFTVMPMYVLGFSQTALYGYIVIVYFWSAMVHSNVRLNLGSIESWVVTPRYHHWHHGLEREAIDVNFAVHFPMIDRIFRTYYLPADKWPAGYGVLKPEIPKGYGKQLLFPLGVFRTPKRESPEPAAEMPANMD